MRVPGDGREIERATAKKKSHEKSTHTAQNGNQQREGVSREQEAGEWRKGGREGNGGRKREEEEVNGEGKEGEEGVGGGENWL